MLSKDDVDKMVRDAEEHADEDKQRREEVETRNQAEQLTYQAERTLSDLGDKVSAEDQAEVETQVASLREALKGSDVELIRSGMNALMETLTRVSTAAYQASASEAGPTNGAGGGDGAGARPRAKAPAAAPDGRGRAPRATRRSRASSRRSEPPGDRARAGANSVPDFRQRLAARITDEDRGVNGSRHGPLTGSHRSLERGERSRPAPIDPRPRLWLVSRAVDRNISPEIEPVGVRNHRLTSAVRAGNAFRNVTS